MSAEQIRHAYRHLYRGLLQAVQFSKLHGGIARDQLRKAFRDKNATFEAESVKRTIWFVEAAARERGLEHKILKNLLRAARARSQTSRWKYIAEHDLKPKTGKQVADEEVLSSRYNHYDMTIAMLNKSMGLCLR